jgi:hypothetical protein
VRGSEVQRFRGSKVQRFRGSKVQGFRGSRVQRFKGSEVQRFRGSEVQSSGLGTRTKLKIRSPRKKCWFCHIIAKYHFPDLWECESGRFSHTKGLQNNA